MGTYVYCDSSAASGGESSTVATVRKVFLGCERDEGACGGMAVAAAEGGAITERGELLLPATARVLSLGVVALAADDGAGLRTGGASEGAAAAVLGALFSMVTSAVMVSFTGTGAAGTADDDAVGTRLEAIFPRASTATSPVTMSTEAAEADGLVVFGPLLVGAADFVSSIARGRGEVGEGSAADESGGGWEGATDGEGAMRSEYDGAVETVATRPVSPASPTLSPSPSPSSSMISVTGNAADEMGTAWLV